MLTEYEASQRHQHIGRNAEAAPHVALQCVVLLMIAAVLSIFGSAIRDEGSSGIRQAQLNVAHPCQDGHDSPEHMHDQTSPRSLNTSTASRTQPFDAGKPQ
jgi:hypothetical protein